MLIGEHTHTVDAKRRVSFPAKFRKVLGSSVVVTRGLDSSLFVFSLPEWSRVAGKLETLSMGSTDSRAFTRFMLGSAALVGIDSLGRILVPEYLASYAGITETATIIGVSNRVEIWEPTRWQAYQARVLSDADQLAARLGDIGAL
jgi:MraZ protein